MSIQSNNYFQNESLESLSRRLKSHVRGEHFHFPKAAYPEDLPFIEAHDEESLGDMYPSDGIYQIEDF